MPAGARRGTCAPARRARGPRSNGGAYARPAAEFSVTEAFPDSVKELPMPGAASAPAKGAKSAKLGAKPARSAKPDAPAGPVSTLPKDGSTY